MRPLFVLLVLVLTTAAQADRYGSIGTTSSAEAQQGFTPLANPAASTAGGSDTRFGGSSPLSQPTSQLSTGQLSTGQLGSSSLTPPSPSRVQPLSTPSTYGNRTSSPLSSSSATTPLSQSAASQPTGQLTGQASTFSSRTPNRFNEDRFSTAGQSQPQRFSQASNDKPTALMLGMLKAPPNSQLTGTPITLAEVVSGAPTRDEQSHRIEAYWDLCASVADYYLGLHEAEELRKLQARMPSVSNALREAANELQIRVGTSRKAAHASQQQLASQMGRLGEVLPGDMPYCGRYNTRFEEIFAGQPAPEARELHELLPLRYAELAGAAEAVTRSEQFVQTQSQRQTASSNGSAMIRALELLALNRRAFVQIAKDYNRRITRYAEISRPGRIDNGRLVAMLIGSSSNSTNLSFRSPSGFR